MNLKVKSPVSVGGFSISKPFFAPDYDVLSFGLSKHWAHGLWTGTSLASLPGDGAHSRPAPSGVPHAESQAAAKAILPWDLGELFLAGTGRPRHTARLQ